jgi:2-octaprenyl-6-methoxyphenol hydroxylase
MHYDMIIVGGGLVGASLAMALQGSGLSIALLDARAKEGQDPRLFALNHTSCQFLNNLGLWKSLAVDASPIHTVHVSRQGYFGCVRLNHDDVHLDSLGHVIPAHKIESVLHNSLCHHPSLTLYQPAKLSLLQQQNDRVMLTMTTPDGDKTLFSPIVIGADGPTSTVRTVLNIPTRVVDYHQSALVTRTELNRPHQQIAYERFTTTGAIAMLPLMNNQCATIWTADTSIITHLMTLSDKDFLEILQKEFGYRLGRLRHISTRHMFPLQMLQAEKKAVQGVLLLGNAAHTLHPIAAQGFNLALYEVAVLTELILGKVRENDKVTSELLLHMNHTTCKQQTISSALSHRLSQLFLTQSTLMNTVLQLGMMSLDILTPIKIRCIETILGKSGRTPRLLLSTNEC